jgi:hypothetical protein
MSLVIDGDRNTITKNTATITVTDALVVPTGTTAQRPTSPIAGMIRFNTTTNKVEGYTGTLWAELI